jgi:hypothetical protein
LPAIISFFEFLPLSERGQGASYPDAMSNPFHPFLIFSYVAPLGVWRVPHLSGTDPLERNSYFGIISFLLLIAGFFIHFDNKLVRFCKWAFFISLIFSFGEMAGLRSLAYYLLPLMNTFRHPANIKLFTIFFACIVAAFSLQEFSSRNIFDRYKKWGFYFVTGLLLATLLSAVFLNVSMPAENSDSQLSVVQKIKYRLDQLSFLQLIGISFILQLPFLVLAYFNFVKNLNLKWLVPGGIANCVLFTMLFQPFTVIKKDSVSQIQVVLNTVTQREYPLPDLDASLSENSKDGEKYFKEIGALNMYNKKIGRINYRIAPSNLNTQNEFWRNVALRNKLMSYPLLYHADTAVVYSTFTIDTSVSKKIVLVENPTVANLINAYTKQATSEIRASRFDPNNFDFEIDCAQRRFYCLMQNYYPRWRLSVDGVPTEIVKCNISFMGFQLEPGHHRVSFRYKMNDLVISFYLNLALSFLIIISGIVQLFKSSSPARL